MIFKLLWEHSNGPFEAPNTHSEILILALNKAS